MRILTSLMLLLALPKVHGQISIIHTDMPQSGDTVRYSISALLPTGYRQGGADKVWDFSTIRPTSQDVIKYYPTTSTPYFFQFFTASYGLPQNISLGPAGGGIISNPYGYYRINPTALVNMGFGASVQGLPLGLVLNPRDTIFKFPLEYQKEYAGSYSGSVGFAGLGSINQSGTRTTVVDGWGSIKTPFGTFDCIRVKCEVEGVDSIEFSGFPIPIPNSKTEYYWFGKNQKFPLMEIIMNNVNNQPTIRYKDINRPELYRGNARFNASRTKATTKDTVNLNNQSINNPTGHAWTITPNTFVYVAGTNANSQSPRIIFTSPGSYSIKLAVSYLGGFDDTLRSEYISITEATTSLQDLTLNDNSFTIFPNPGKDWVEVKSTLSKSSQVTLYNTLGQALTQFKLGSKETHIIHTDQYPAGIYYVEMRSDSQKVTKKLFIE